MREIKFRAWDKKFKIMINPTDSFADYIGFDGTIHEIGEYSNYSGGGKTDEDVSKQYEVMQWTGIKDIFEGDIVSARIASDKARFVGYVHYLNCQYWVNYIGYESYYVELMSLVNAEYEPIEVIGNIYQNPELMNP
jgi:uncharacterized phage protein (TIGR01671 family)